MNTFLTLMRKDVRILRAPLILLAVLGTLPYLVLQILMLADAQRTVAGAILYSPWIFSWYGTDVLNITSLLLMAAAGLLGGMAFASERRSGSMTFLACLPVSKTKMILSKLMVCMAAILAAEMIPLTLMALQDIKRLTMVIDYSGVEIIAVMCWPLTAYAFSWLLSMFVRSAAIAGCVGIAIACGMRSVMANFVLYRTFHFINAGHAVAVTLPIAMGREFVTYGLVILIALATALGTICHARRVAP